MTSSSNIQQPLLLHARLSDGQEESSFVQNKIRIGQDTANNIVLPEDRDVAPYHAAIEKRDDGYVLCASRKEFPLMVERNGRLESVSEIPLTSGTNFQIGSNYFSCTQITSTPTAAATGWDQLKCCPYCQSTNLPSVSRANGQAETCPNCGKSIFLFFRSDNTQTVYVIPGIFNGWTVDRYVAHGGMGIVFHAKDPGGDVRAIKVFLPSQDNRRFDREVEAMKRVNHINTVRLDHVGVEASLSYMIMEWVEGENLASIIARNRKNGTFVDYVNQGRSVMMQALQGLAAIHQAGIIHRDIKPSNILVTPTGLVKIADMGIAKTIHEETSMVTVTGMAPGTYRYMSPEQMSRPDAVQTKSDIYSMGITFYEFLTNDFPGASGWHEMDSVNPTVPKPVDDIVRKMLEKISVLRPDCGEIVRLIEKTPFAIKNESPEPKPEKSKPDPPEPPDRGSKSFEHIARYWEALAGTLVALWTKLKFIAGDWVNKLKSQLQSPKSLWSRLKDAAQFVRTIVTGCLCILGGLILVGFVVCLVFLFFDFVNSEPSNPPIQPPVPVKIETRVSRLFEGKVAIFTAYDKELNCTVHVVNRPKNQSKTFDLHLAPRQKKEYGMLEISWHFDPGEEIHVEAKGYSPIKYTVP